MFADPQSITISAVPISLPRVSSGVNAAAYASADSTLKFAISNAYGRRNRRTVRMEHSKIAADPLTSANSRYSMTSYLVIDTPLVGYTVTEAQAVIAGFTAWLTASSGANVAKVLGGEN